MKSDLLEKEKDGHWKAFNIYDIAFHKVKMLSKFCFELNSAADKCQSDNI